MVVSKVLVTWELVLFSGMDGCSRIQGQNYVVTLLQENEMTSGFQDRNWILCI